MPITDDTNASFQIQIATIIIPYLGKSAGRFCRFFKCDEGERLGVEQAHVYAQFDGQKSQWLDEPSLVNSNRRHFDFSKKCIEDNSSTYEKLKDLDTDFIRFCAEENRDTFIWDFILSEDKIEEIWSLSESGKRMQIFTVSFDNKLQIDPTLMVSKVSQSKTDLLFRTEYSAFIAHGIITNHTSITLEEYEAKTCHDPARHYASKVYFDDLIYADLSSEMDFDAYLQKVRPQLNSSPNPNVMV